MKQYLELLRDVMTNGSDREDRTGVGTRSVFGRQMRMNLQEGFPLLTTKKVHFKSVLVELLWFLRGDTNIKFLHEHGVTIWDEWADEHGDLGPVYGAQWRFWPDYRKALAPIPAVSTSGLDSAAFATVTHGTIDQIRNLITDLIVNPFSRRHIVSAWNPADVPHMKLPPCHTLWQCYVRQDPSLVKELSLHLYARSIDIFLGLPFNIASYAILLEILARITGMRAGELVISFGDLHLYRNHFQQAEEQLSREPRPLPRLTFIDHTVPLEQLTVDQFALEDYFPHPAIKAPIAV